MMMATVTMMMVTAARRPFQGALLGSGPQVHLLTALSVTLRGRQDCNTHIAQEKTEMRGPSFPQAPDLGSEPAFTARTSPAGAG